MIGSRLTRWLATGLTALALTGCSNKPLPWTEAQVKEISPLVRVPLSDGGNYYSKEFQVEDLDGDHKIDVVHSCGHVICVAEGYQNIVETKGYRLADKCVVMTPEMRGDLTQIAESQKDFAKRYLAAQGLLKEK